MGINFRDRQVLDEEWIITYIVHDHRNHDSEWPRDWCHWRFNLVWKLWRRSQRLLHLYQPLLTISTAYTIHLDYQIIIINLAFGHTDNTCWLHSSFCNGPVQPRWVWLWRYFYNNTPWKCLFKKWHSVDHCRWLDNQREWDRISARDNNWLGFRGWILGRY